jgi:hypothetical protein
MEDPKNQFSKNQIFILFRPVLSSFLARFEFFFDPFEFFMSQTAAPPRKPTHGAQSGHHGGRVQQQKPPKKNVKIWFKFVPTPPQAVPALTVCLKIGHAAADCLTVQNCRALSAHRPRIYTYMN